MFAIMKNFFNRNIKSEVFTTKLTWVRFPPDTFDLEGYLGEQRIAKATGDFEKNGAFRLVKIDVTNSHRSMGYGSKMINELLVEAKKMNCTEFVFVGVAVKNERAAKLYKSRFNANPRPIANCGDKEDYVLIL